jgi:hypothetical protein
VSLISGPAGVTHPLYMSRRTLLRLATACSKLVYCPSDVGCSNLSTLTSIDQAQISWNPDLLGSFVVFIVGGVDGVALEKGALMDSIGRSGPHQKTSAFMCVQWQVQIACTEVCLLGYVPPFFVFSNLNF